MLFALLSLLVASDTLTTAERARIRAAIVFVSERGGSKDVRVIEPTGRGDRALVGTRADEYPAAVSPDGRFVAVVASRDSAGRHFERIAVTRLRDGATRFHAVGVARARNPSWSRDGRWLAIETDAHGFSDIVRIPVGGGRASPMRLTSAPEGSFEPAVSPRGDAIAFVTSRDGDAEVYVMRTDGSGTRRLTAFHRDDWGPAWSPDARTIAFLSARTGTGRVFLTGADGTGTRALNRGAAADEELSPAWSPDGRSIAYVTRPRGGRARLWVTDVRTARRRALTDAGTASTDPAWSPDGRYIAFASDRDGDGDSEIYLMRSDGSGQTRLTHARGADWLPRWAPRK